MFAGRRSDGTIYGVWSCRQRDDADHPNMEELPETHPDIVTFRNRAQSVSAIETLQSRCAALEAKIVGTIVEIA